MRLKRVVLGVGVLVVAALAVAGIASADGAESRAIDACVSRLTGSVRIIDPQHPKPCSEHFERALSWARQGPPGPQGPAGPAAPSIWAVLVPKPGGGGVFEVRNGRHITGATYNNEHIITVTFDTDVSRCAYMVTPRSEPALLNHTVAARPVPNAPNKIEVELTEGTTGNWHVLPFQVFVVC
mgnify:CR=1 FL=1